MSESLCKRNLITDMRFTPNGFLARMHVVLLIVFANALYGLAEPHPLPVPSTPMEAALDALRTRFPNQVVVAFEELRDTRPGGEPHVDLGPPDSSLKQVVDRIRHANPKYKVDLQTGFSEIRVR